jgi:hypothetical protein
MSAAAASVIGLAAAPALAATTWTVKPGGAVTGTAGTTTVTDTTAGASVTCTSSAVKGTLKTGSGLAGAGIGTVTTLTFKGCTVFGSITVTLMITGKMPLNATAYKATTKVATMFITKIHAKFSVAGLCSATIDGTGGAAHNGKVEARFSDKTNTLTVLATGGNLHLYNVTGSGCSTGNINNHDSVNFTGAYKFTPKTTITSP